MMLIARLTKIATISWLISFLAGCGGGGSANQAPEALQSVDTSVVTPRDPGSSLPVDWRNGVFMQIFVRSYQDSNGDGIGDLKGLISRLDYLKTLGVSGIWLMPIHPSQDRDHGYAVKNYREIATEYGALADLDELLTQAHMRGIGVILDYVINHSAATHPAFVNSKSSVSNDFRDWYVWQSSAPSGWSIYGANPWYSTSNGAYFAGFWDQMPDFNLKSSNVISWHQDNLRFWLNRGVDGFRFDAVGNLVENGANAWENQPENHSVMAGVQAVVSGYQKRFMVCEAPALPQRYAMSDSCGRSFAFDYHNSLVSAIEGNVNDVSTLANYWLTAPDGMAGFASNHDSFAGQRLADQLNSDPDRMRLVAATYLLQSRSPFIYYGEEIGMKGASNLYGDPKLRTPMSWTSNVTHAGFSTVQPYRSLSANSVSVNVSTQDGDLTSLLNFYRDVIALRQSLPSLQKGIYSNPQANGDLMAFHRTFGNERAVVVFNYASSPQSLSVSGLSANSVLERKWPHSGGDVSANSSGVANISLPTKSFAVFKSAV